MTEHVSCSISFSTQRYNYPGQLLDDVNIHDLTNLWSMSSVHRPGQNCQSLVYSRQMSERRPALRSVCIIVSISFRVLRGMFAHMASTLQARHTTCMNRAENAVSVYRDLKLRTSHRLVMNSKDRKTSPRTTMSERQDRVTGDMMECTIF